MELILRFKFFLQNTTNQTTGRENADKFSPILFHHQLNAAVFEKVEPPPIKLIEIWHSNKQVQKTKEVFSLKRERCSVYYICRVPCFNNLALPS